MATVAKDDNIVLFSRINDFVNELDKLYGTKFHSLKLYKHMLSKTNVSHKLKINHSVETFTRYLVANKTVIMKKSLVELKDNIVISNKMMVPLIEIIKLSDNEVKEVISQHLIAMLSCVDKSKEVNDILKDIINPSTNEGKFFNNLIGKIEQKVGDMKDGNNPPDPMKVLSSLMQSGVIQDVISSMSEGTKDGTLDLSKMFGMVQGMFGNISGNINNVKNNK